jgi:hypothetical protein
MKAVSRSQAPIALINAPVNESKHVMNRPSISLILKETVATKGARKAMNMPRRNFEVIDDPADVDSEVIIADFIMVCSVFNGLVEGGDKPLVVGKRVGSKPSLDLVWKRNAKGAAVVEIGCLSKCFLNQCLKHYPRAAAVAKSTLHAASV